MVLVSKCFNAVSIRGSGSLLTLIDLSLGTVVFSVNTTMKRVSIAPEYTLSLNNIEVNASGSLSVGILRIDGVDGAIYLNDVVYIHTPIANTDNLGIGLNTLSHVIVPAFRNTAIGHDALVYVTTGDRNTAVGQNSSKDMTTGNLNTSVGVNALFSTTTGSDNVCVGSFSMIINIVGSRNTTIGTNSMSDNLVDENTAVGYSSLAYNSTGLRNTAMGVRCLEGVSSNSHSDNTAVGYHAIMAVTTGDNNTAIGSLCLENLTTGSNNVALGQAAGSVMPVTQNHCILIKNTGSTVVQDGEIHLGNSTDQTQTFIHAPFITDKKTTSSGAGAIPITGCFHEITTTGADALTLANGVDGQHLYIVMMVDGGAGILTPSTFIGGTTITFDNVGDSAHLMYTATGGWVFMGGSATVA